MPGCCACILLISRLDTEKEALQLFRDCAAMKSGGAQRPRLWLELLIDLTISLKKKTGSEDPVANLQLPTFFR